jgi:acyl-CoA synthetase (AMP-forming)/AMP-acid ligase II
MIFKSPHPDVIVPEIPVTAFVLGHADKNAERTALIDGVSGHLMTYGELAGSVRQAANGLQRRGFDRGDVCAIYSPNLPEFAVAYHAVASAGGVVTPVNPLYTAGELAHQLNDAGARYLITTADFLDNARSAASQSGIEALFVFGESEGEIAFDSLLQGDNTDPDVTIDPVNDLVVLPYSSGTTGLSKGVMLTHHNLVANTCQLGGVNDFYQVTETDTLVGILPFFHIYGLMILLHYALSRGARIVTIPRFDIDLFLAILQDHRVTMAYIVPTIVRMLATHPSVGSFDLSGLRLVNSGGAPLGKDLAISAADRIGCPVVQGYGLTETSPVTHCGLFTPGKYVADSIGPCIPNTESKVIDHGTGEELSHGGVGEIWIRGPQVMKGYLNRTDATAETIDNEGWLRTGDIGFADENGNFYIVDRLKELIKYKGYQVPPAELEEILVAHPCIADAAVVGSPDEEAGELPKAFVVATDSVLEEEIKAFVSERVAPHKKIRLVEFVDEIPRAPSGKILRRLLRDRERQRVSKKAG